MAPDAILVDPQQIIDELKSAETLLNVLTQAGIAFADIAQQTSAISDTLGSVVSGAAAPAADTLNVEATINGGSAIEAEIAGSIDATVTIDCLSERAEEFVDGRLSKAAQAVFALWAAADQRITAFGTSLDRSICKVADGICDLKPLAEDVGRSLHKLTDEVKEMKGVLNEQQKCICEGVHRKGWFLVTSTDEEELARLARLEALVTTAMEQEALEEMLEHLHPWASSRLTTFAEESEDSDVIRPRRDTPTGTRKSPATPTPPRPGGHRGR